jgi:hypothetical protein
MSLDIRTDWTRIRCQSFEMSVTPVSFLRNFMVSSNCFQYAGFDRYPHLCAEQTRFVSSLVQGHRNIS